MRDVQITLPELVLIAGTRAALGGGLGLLLADRLPEGERRAVRLRVGGEERWAAAEDVARFRDALGAALPPGLPTAFLEPVDDPVRSSAGLGGHRAVHGARHRAAVGAAGVSGTSRTLGEPSDVPTVPRSACGRRASLGTVRRAAARDRVRERERDAVERVVVVVQDDDAPGVARAGTGPAADALTRRGQRRHADS